MKKVAVQSGFTLIEILVALSVFGLVGVLAVGSVVSTSTNYRRVESETSALRDLKSAFETVASELRTGSTWECYDNDVVQSDCSGSWDEFRFLNDRNEQISYYFADTPGNSRTQLVREDATTTRVAAVTGPDIDFSSWSFALNGHDPSDTIQPGLRINVVGTWYGNGTSEQFHYETYVTQRNLDNDQL